MIHNHRQVHRVIQVAMLEGADKKLLAQIDQMRQEGFGWRYDGLDDWSNDAIFDQLNALGIDTDRDRFKDQVRAAGRILDLEERWREGVDIEENSTWDDFTFIAAETLWRRLTPHILCPEIVADRIEHVIDYPAEGISPDEDFDEFVAAEGMEAIDAATVLVEYLERFAPQQRDAAFDEVIHCSTYDFGSWLMDVVADHGGCYPGPARRIADVMTQTTYGAVLWADLALAWIGAGRTEVAIETVHNNLMRWPCDIWVRIKSGDVFNEAGEDDIAVKHYTRALAMARTPCDWDGVAERLTPLLRQLGRKNDWDLLVDEYPRPADPPILPFDIAQRNLHDSLSVGRESNAIGVISIGPSPQLIASSGDAALPIKPGRNDRCPCGSGKKYKRCCLGGASVDSCRTRRVPPHDRFHS